MMGPKKLSEIREELRYHLSKDREDPIAWIKKRMAESPRESSVLRSMLELLQEPGGVQKPKARPPAAEGRKLVEELESFCRSLEAEVKRKPKPQSKKSRPVKKR